MFNFNKKKIKEQEEIIARLESSINILSSQNSSLNKELKVYTDKENEKYELTKTINLLTQERDKLLNEAESIERMAVAGNKLDLTKYQDATSCYKDMLHVQEEIKQMVKDGTAIVMGAKELAINNSTAEGKKFIHNIANLMLKAFNAECNKYIENTNVNAPYKAINNIYKSAMEINKIGESVRLTINPVYLDNKIKLVDLVAEYKTRKKLEAEIIKEQVKAEKELTKERNEQLAYLEKLKKKHDKENNEDVLNLIERVEKDLHETEERLANNRAGYVYVVSCPDLKDNLYKIGVTRRDVETRMSELANASHSFSMEVHGYVFVDDCFGTEAQLHNYLADKRLNVLNIHKEWFVTSLNEITKAFKDCCGIDIILTDNPSDEYLASKEKFDFL